MRGKQAPKHKIVPDEIYNSELVTKLINYVMLDGKRNVARSIVYKALEDLSEKTKLPAAEALEKALGNVKPKLEIRSRRVGGANYQVPMPVNTNRQNSLALRWTIQAMRKARGKRQSWEALSSELYAAFKGEGEAVRKREDVHRMADANKAFSQFAW